MAAIQNSINLQDRMTPVLRSVMKTMNSTLNAMRSLDKQMNGGMQSKAFKQAEQDMKRTNNQIIRMQNNLDNSSRSANRLADSTSRVSRNMNSMKSGGVNLMNLASAVYLLDKIQNGLQNVMKAPDSARATQARLGLYNESGLSNEQLYGNVYKTALATRTDLESTGNLATRILISGAMEGEGSAAGAIKITELINKALVAGGGTSEENNRALLQLSQGLASGVLQGDELRAIREQTPYLTKVMAEGLGKLDPKFAGTTIGQLKQLGADGELTAERILKSFQLMEKEINSDFKQMPKTFGQAMTQIKSVWSYFLYMLSTGDGALAKINEKMWQFANYLASPAGEKTLTNLAKIITGIVNVALFGIDAIVASMQYLGDHTDVLQAALITLGVVAVGTAVKSAIAWVAAAWPILLVVSAIGIAVYAMLQCGMSAQQVVGGICGTVMFLVYLILDIVALTVSGVYIIVAVIWNLLVGAITAVILAIQLVAQVLLWVVGGAIDGVIAIGLGFYSLGEIIKIALSTALIFIYGKFVTFGSSVLDIIAKIASGIDAVFGSNLAGAVNGWKSGLQGSLETLSDKLDPKGQMDDLKKTWENAPWIDFSKDSAWNITDNMSDVYKGAENFLLDPWASTDFLLNNDILKNPMDGWNQGNQFGTDLVDFLTKYDFSMGTEGLNDMLSKWDPNSVTMNGGDLDSVGKIKGDVDLSEQDIKLLRDIAAREFLLNVQSITPSVKATFGDVRETADVNAIMDLIEDMVVQSAATSLVE